MQMRAQGLLNAAKYIEERFGRDRLGELLRSASPAVRATYTSCIGINWHPVEELCEFSERADGRLATGDGMLIQEIGAAGARASLKRVGLRVAVYRTRPEILMTRVAAMWSQFNDEGSMPVLEVVPPGASEFGTTKIEVRGVVAPPTTFCRTLTG